MIIQTFVALKNMEYVLNVVPCTKVWKRIDVMEENEFLDTHVCTIYLYCINVLENSINILYCKKI